MARQKASYAWWRRDAGFDTPQKIAAEQDAVHFGRRDTGNFRNLPAANLIVEI